MAYKPQLGVDIWEAIEAAATKPFGYMKFTPGPGVGGHCLPVDPSYLSWHVRRQLGQSFRFVELANDVNDHMPDYVLQRAIRLLNDHGKAIRGAQVFLVGLAYKRDTGDIRESPSLRLIDLLNGYGAIISAVDAHVEDHRWPADVSRAELTQGQIESADLVILLTDHSDFDLGLLESSSVPVLDTKNRTQGPHVTPL